MKTHLLSLLFVLLALTASGCIIEESVGPEGPPGNANVFSLGFDFVL